MQKLAVFTLPAVIRYDQELIMSYLLDAINKVEGSQLKAIDAPKDGNTSQMVMDIYEQNFGSYPSLKKMEKISKKFTKRVKKYFIDEDESFEIRPGVQSIFGHMEKKKKWKYCIISDFWSDATHLMLQSCGVFSKNKLTITADDALTADDQIKIAHKRAKKKNAKVKMFYISGIREQEESKLATVVYPRFSKGSANYFTYPRFSELFK